MTHASCAESQLEILAASQAIKRINLGYRVSGFLDVMNDKSANPVLNDFGNRTARVSDHRRSCGHRFDHNQTERFWPLNWEQKSGSVAQEGISLGESDFSNKLDQWVIRASA